MNFVSVIQKLLMEKHIFIFEMYMTFSLCRFHFSYRFNVTSWPNWEWCWSIRDLHACKQNIYSYGLAMTFKWIFYGSNFSDVADKKKCAHFNLHMSLRRFLLILMMLMVFSFCCQRREISFEMIHLILPMRLMF